MKIGIKYCGGCNPSYDRTENVKKIINEYPEINFEPIKKGVEYDTVLIVNGCLSACSNQESLIFNSKINLSKIEDFSKLESLLKQTSHKQNID